jgi:hypothetical protein
MRPAASVRKLIPSRQNDERLVSERETVVERPWLQGGLLFVPGVCAINPSQVCVLPSGNLQAIHESVPDMQAVAQKTTMKTQARSTRTVGPEITTHTDILDTSQVRATTIRLLRIGTIVGIRGRAAHAAASRRPPTLASTRV